MKRTPPLPGARFVGSVVVVEFDGLAGGIEQRVEVRYRVGPKVGVGPKIGVRPEIGVCPKVGVGPEIRISPQVRIGPKIAVRPQISVGPEIRIGPQIRGVPGTIAPQCGRVSLPELQGLRQNVPSAATVPGHIRCLTRSAQRQC